MNQPLKNKLFISTRPQGKSDELAQLLANEGGSLVEMPLIQIQPAQLSDDEKEWLKQLKKFQWLVFTSPNGVNHFFAYLKENIKQVVPESIQIAVVGGKTEKTLKEHNHQAAFVNPGNTGEEFAEAFSQEIKKAKSKPNVLFLLGTLAGNVIQEKLKNHANCIRINIYETVSPNIADENIVELIRHDRYEMVIFTSPSGIENFLKLTENIKKEQLRIACIGKTTARSAKNKGIEPIVVADEASAKGLVQSIINFYEQK